MITEKEKERIASTARRRAKREQGRSVNKGNATWGWWPRGWDGNTRSCAPGTPPCRFGRKLVPSRTLVRVSTSSHALTRDPRGGCYPGTRVAGAGVTDVTRALKSTPILAPAPCAGYPSRDPAEDVVSKPVTR